VSAQTQSIYGYYSKPEQAVPEYDPGIVDVPCPACGVADFTLANVRTISLMGLGDNKSYFYRVHRACHDAMTPEQHGALDGLLIDAIYSARNVN